MLVPCPVDSSKVSNVAKNDKINNVEDKINHITNLATNTTLNAKINVVKTKYLVLLTWKIAVNLEFC